MADLNIRDCFSLLIEDHRAVEELYERYSESDDLESKKQYLRVFIRDLSIHSGIEEAYVYPLMDKNLKHGGSLHQFSLDQHQHLKEDLKYLDTTELTEDNVTDFNQRLFGLIADLKHHTDHEEKDVFPAMRDALSMEQRADLLSQLEKAKSMVPTHPHPHTPNVSLTGLNIITTIQGYIDRSLDLYKGVDKNLEQIEQEVQDVLREEQLVEREMATSVTDASFAMDPLDEQPKDSLFSAHHDKTFSQELDAPIQGSRLAAE